MAFVGGFCPVALVSSLGRNWRRLVSRLQCHLTTGERIDSEAGTAASYGQHRRARLWCGLLSVLDWTVASNPKGIFIRSCRLVDLRRVHLVQRHLADGRSHAWPVRHRHHKFACTDLVADRTSGAERYTHGVFHYRICQSLSVLIFMVESHRL